MQKGLETKYKLGLFDGPYRYCNEERAAKEIYSEANRKEARAISAESLYCKNADNTLPVKNRHYCIDCTGRQPLKYARHMERIC